MTRQPRFRNGLMAASPATRSTSAMIDDSIVARTPDHPMGFRCGRGAASLSPAGRLANLLGQAGLPGAIKLRSVSPAFDPFLAQRIELSHHPKSDNCEVMIKRVGKPYSRTLHDDEASCVDSGQFVQVGAPEIFPRPLQIA
jgi:hypothetical protein